MKKILAALLAVMMMLTMVAIPTFAAEEDFAVTAETVKANPGQENVEVAVNVTNNPGMAGIVLTVKYDTDALTLKSYTNGAVFAGTVPQVALNYVWAAGADSAVNGTLVTFVFDVNEAAALGEYTIDIEAKQCTNTALADLYPVSVDGVINVVEPVSEITGTNMALGENLTVNYYAKLLATETAAKMVFTMNNQTVEVAGVQNADGLYVYAFSGVAPHRMGDNIKAELKLGDKVLDTVEEFSAKDYCINILDSDAAALNITEDQYAYLTVLVADLLEYGAMAQVYNQYNTDALVNADSRVAANKSSWTDINAIKGKFSIGTSAVDGWGITAATVYFYDVNSLYIKVKADDPTAIVYVENYDEMIELSACEYDETTGVYLVKITDLAPADYGTKFTIGLYTADFDEVQTLTYSVAAYVRNVQDQTTDMANLAKAVYTYALSAVAYAEA